MATKVGKKRGTVSARAQSGNFSGSNSQASNPLISDAKLKQILATMLQCRILEQRLRRLQGRNKAREEYKLPPLREAVAVGAAIDLRREDWIAPARGDVVAGFIKGAPLNAIFTQFNAGANLKNGAAKGRSAAGREAHSLFRVVPASATALTHLSVAAGVALTMREEKSGNIVMAFIDGPISGASFHDALHFAGVHCLPLVVVVQIAAGSVNRKSRPADLVGADYACGFPVIPVDAHDVVAIYRVAHESIHKARHGGGPTLIEATAFRVPARRAGSNAHGGKLPNAIGKMEDYLIAKGLYSPSWKQKVLDRFDCDVESAIESAREAPSRRPKQVR